MPTANPIQTYPTGRRTTDPGVNIAEVTGRSESARADRLPVVARGFPADCDITS